MIFSFFKKKKKYPEVERRREPRTRADDEFAISFVKGKNGTYGYSRDISLHGVRFATSMKLRKGLKMDLEFCFPKEFPGARKIKVKAVIVRSYRPSSQARFRSACLIQHESELTKEVLKQFIAWLQSSGQ